MKRKSEPCDAPLKVWVPRSLFDKIQLAAAAARYRSTSEFIRNVLEDALATRDAQSESTE